MSRLFSFNYDGGHPGDQPTALRRYRKLNSRAALIMGLVSRDERTGNIKYDFDFADKAYAANPSTQIVYRPYRENLENDLPLYYTVDEMALELKTQLAGRPYKIAWGNEPAFYGEQLKAYLDYSNRLLHRCAEIGVELAIWGFQPTAYNAYPEQGRESYLGDMWREVVKTLSDLRHIHWLRVNEYTAFLPAAGVFDDKYLERVVWEQELLQDPATWATAEQCYPNPSGKRHLLRYYWLTGILTQKMGIPSPTVMLGECWLDRREEESLEDEWARADGIAGEKIRGFRSLSKWWERFKFPNQSTESLLIKHYKYALSLYRHDPNVVATCVYNYSFEPGQWEDYNHGGLSEAFFDEMAAENNPVVKPPPPPPIVIEPTVLCVAYPTAEMLNVRPQPNLNNTPVEIVKRGTALKVFAPENAQAMIGKIDMWVNVITPSGKRGWAAAWLLVLDVPAEEEPPKPPPKPSWRDGFSAMELAWIDHETARDKTGIIAKLVMLQT